MTQYILPVLASVVFAQVVGMLWYSKMLFGGTWMKAAGITPEKMEAGKKKMAPYIIGAVLGAMVTAVVLLYTIRMFGVPSLALGVKVGGFMWLGYVMITQLDSVFWDGKSVTYFFINTSYSLVRFVGMGAILGAWLS